MKLILGILGVLGWRSGFDYRIDSLHQFFNIRLRLICL